MCVCLRFSYADGQLPEGEEHEEKQNVGASSVHSDFKWLILPNAYVDG